MQLYNFSVPGAAAPTYTTTSTFSALQFRADVNAPVGYSFLNGAPGPIAPVVRTLPDPAAAPPLPSPQLWVSDQGNLAIEQADLTRRQPRHFFASQNAVADWNRALAQAGSDFQLIPEPGATVTFVPPAGGAPRTLIKIFPVNLNLGLAGDRMRTTENCDVMVMNVTGGGGVFGAAMQPVFTAPVYVAPGQDTLSEYFAAIALTGGHAANTPITVAPVATLQASQNAIAKRYGQAVFALKSGNPVVANPTLDHDLQVRGINQYARPARIGQGLWTTSLGTRAASVGGSTAQDYSNSRALTAQNINDVAWGFHWGGVVAIDGADYVTLENYARGAEISPAVVPLIGAPPAQEHLYYFQMYGTGAGRSWHEQWETPGPRGKGFANGITMVVEPSGRAGLHYFVAGSKDGAAAVAGPGGAGAGNQNAFERALLNGLNYANVHLYAPAGPGRLADKARLAAWRAAVNPMVAGPLPPFTAGAAVQTQALVNHVAASLNAVTPNPV
ncbi:conserved hypothetical protein [Frankia sp. Hr75.2]|nr:conserved hypothetical protein [Frankia sp. Hr75.2]